MNSQQGSFRQLLIQSEDPVTLCVQFLLSWIAICDGHLSDKEQDFITKTFSIPSNGKINIIYNLVLEGGCHDITTMCNIFRVIDKEKKELLLELALMLSLSDGILAIPEIHILHLLSDVLGFNQNELNTIFNNLTGKEFPYPSDISNTEWWQKRTKKENSNRKKTSDSHDEYRDNKRTIRCSSGMTRAKALSILGLEEDAKLDEIKQVYRRLANIHHPDKFHALGPEAVAVATETFKRINEAYEYLRA